MANAAMFVAEAGAGFVAQSVSLLADAIDFFGDAANYALSLAAFAWLPVKRARVAQVKAGSMALFGAFVLYRSIDAAVAGSAPEPVTMSVLAIVALAVNIGVAVMLFRYREGDADMRSVWLCTRNDALGNLAVLAAAAGVLGTATRWPDLLVASLMAVLAFTSARSVWRAASIELRAPVVAPAGN